MGDWGPVDNNQAGDRADGDLGTGQTEVRNQRVGLVFFALYAAAYGSFVALLAFAPELMKRPWWGGFNGAVTAGVGLIWAAAVMSFVFGWWVRLPVPPPVPRPSRSPTEK